MNKRTTYSLLLTACCLLLPLGSIAQNNLIPNTQDCSGTRPPFAFQISQLWSAPGVSNASTPLAGDIDGDGNVEVLVAGSAGNILFFDGLTGAGIGTIITPSLNTTSFLICDVDRCGQAEIFNVTATRTATLYKITSAPGVRPLVFTTVWSINLPNINGRSYTYPPTPFVADLDGDGVPEFIAAGHIIRADGTICPTALNFEGIACSGGSPSGTIYAATPYAVDLDGDGIPEICVGTDVYKYDGVTATLWKRCPAIPAGKEGSNMAADVNLDGFVDLVYHDSDHSNSVAGQMIVWTPALAPAPGVSSAQGVIGSFTTVVGYTAYPVVGDIDGILAPDGKNYPEICYNSSGNKFTCMGFDGTSFFTKWTMPTNENSGLATFTYFDFNLDGLLELVYRDEQVLRILDASGGGIPVTVFSMPATSPTLIETPIVADVTGNGSANILVTGSGYLYCFEGGASKWASCPPVWNQQLYSNLLINTDLTIASNVSDMARVDIDCNSNTLRLYNGGPMQAPYVSETSFCPIDLSPDVYILSGSITILSASAVEITIVAGNQGLAVAPTATPIRYYQNDIAPANILASANATLGVDLSPGQTITIIKTISGLSPMPTKFYVRLLDDGANFPAAGAFSDCNLSNNTKSFGTFELSKSANSLSSCIDGTTVFTLEVINNSNQLQQPSTYTNIVITDSLGMDWDFISATPLMGSATSYNAVTHKLTWNIPVLAPQDTARLLIAAKAQTSGSLRNISWIESVGGALIGKEFIEAYVIVAIDAASSPPGISPANPSICAGETVLLTATGAGGAIQFQWYKDDAEIFGATLSTYTAATTGTYSVAYFDGSCFSQRSAAVSVTASPPVTPSLNITVVTD